MKSIMHKKLEEKLSILEMVLLTTQVHFWSIMGASLL